MSQHKIRNLTEHTRTVHLETLVHSAISIGASEASIIASKDILVQDSLANRCIEPKCIYYGLSPSCPPHVAGPLEFRNLQKTHIHAIVLRIIVPSAVLFSDQGKDIMRLLHEIVATVEKEAIEMGYPNSKAFAGGSCKIVFCDDHLECQRLSNNGKCRNPQYARPSMSGHGIHVNDLIKKCGWTLNVDDEKEGSNTNKLSWVVGLVMLG